MRLQFNPPPLDPFFAKLDAQMEAGRAEIASQEAQDLEAAFKAFVERSGLDPSDVIIVQFPSGIKEPHWRGVIPEGPSDPQECPECGGKS